MAWLPDGEKISKTSLFVLAQLTNATDGRTDGHRMLTIAALMHSIARQKLTRNDAKCRLLNADPILSVSNATGLPNVPKMTKNDPSLPNKQLMSSVPTGVSNVKCPKCIKSTKINQE